MVAFLCHSSWIYKCLGNGMLEEENCNYFGGGKGVFLERKRQNISNIIGNTWEGYVSIQKKEDRLAAI